MRVARAIELSEEQRVKLTGYARARSVAKRVVERARIVLRAAEGKQDREIAAALQIGRQTVTRWRARFLAQGLAGIEIDASRPGRARTIDADEIVRKTTRESHPTRRTGAPEPWLARWESAKLACDVCGRHTD